MSFRSSFADASLAHKHNLPEEVAPRYGDYHPRKLSRMREYLFGTSLQPSLGIFRNVQSSLPSRSLHRDDVAAGTPVMEIKMGYDSGYSSRERSIETKVLGHPETLIQPLTDLWPPSNAAMAKVPQLASSSTLQIATPSHALSWPANIPFNCYICLASFKYSSDLSRHQTSHSPVEDPKKTGDSADYELARGISHHGDEQNEPSIREQVIPPVVAHNFFNISEVDSEAIPDALPNRVNSGYFNGLNDDGWVNRDNSQQSLEENSQFTGQTTKNNAPSLPFNESSPPLSANVDISSYFSDEETDWGDDDSEESCAEYSTSYFGFFGNSTRKMNNSDSFVELVLSPAKQAMVGRLMKEFWSIFNAETRAVTFNESDFVVSSNNLASSTSSSQAERDVMQSSNSSESYSQSNSVSLRNTSISPSHEKQKRSEDDKNQEDDERDPKRRRTLLSLPLDPSDGPKFVCPYRKHEPHKYCNNIKQWRPCAMTPLASIARVKGHLYRHHRIFPCPRCKVLFESQEEVTLHLGKPEGCEFKESGQEDGITSEVVERLRSKKKTKKGQSEEESWVEIYQLIFPGKSVPSPYFELPNASRELSDYEEYCRRELPRAFRAALEEVVHNDAQIIEDRLRSQLENMIRECQDRVFFSYRSGNASRSQTPLRPMNTDPPTRVSTSVQELVFADTSTVLIRNVQDNLAPSSETDTGMNSEVPKLPSYTLDNLGHTSNTSGLAPSLIDSEIVAISNSHIVSTLEIETNPATSTSMFNLPPIPNPEPRKNHTSEGNFEQDIDNSVVLGCGFAELDLIDWNSYLSAISDTSSL